MGANWLEIVPNSKISGKSGLQLGYTTVSPLQQSMRRLQAGYVIDPLPSMGFPW